MSKPIIKIVNVETGEEIEREMTNDEFAQRQADEAAFAARQAEESVKAQARQAILDRLGLTEEEAKLLLS